MHHGLFVLFETWFDIVRLRKGPEAIPYSPLLFLLTVVVWLVAGAVMTAATPALGPRDFLLGMANSAAGVGCYVSIIVLTGRSSRVLQTASAILGCGALLTLLFVTAHAVLTPLAGADIAGLVSTLILLWSIPVEGHIIARAIERHWYVGVVIATAVFIFQLTLYSLFDPAAGRSG